MKNRLCLTTCNRAFTSKLDLGFRKQILNQTYSEDKSQFTYLQKTFVLRKPFVEKLGKLLQWWRGGKEEIEVSVQTIWGKSWINIEDNRIETRRQILIHGVFKGNFEIYFNCCWKKKINFWMKNVCKFISGQHYKNPISYTKQKKSKAKKPIISTL